jgi:hypothetical protein
MFASALPILRKAGVGLMLPGTMNYRGLISSVAKTAFWVDLATF